MKTIETDCDMASIKIHTKDVSLFFGNGVGDFANQVKILSKKEKVPKNVEFLGHFTVKTEAYLSFYDCDNSIAYTFKPGRYFVSLVPNKCIFYIELIDQDIHA